MEHVLKVVKREDLEKIVKSSEFVLVAFTGITCPACQLYRPVLEELGKRVNPLIRVVEYIVDYDPDPALELGILGTPTTVVYVRGEPREGFTGAVDLPDLVEFLADVAKRYSMPHIARYLDSVRRSVEPILGLW